MRVSPFLPLEADDWFRDCSHILKRGMEKIFCANQADILAGAIIIDGSLQIERLLKAVPEDAAALVVRLYERIPSVPIADILIEVEEKLCFTDAFTDLRTGVACTNRIGLLTVLLADGVNLGLRPRQTVPGPYVSERLPSHSLAVAGLAWNCRSKSPTEYGSSRLSVA